MDNKPMGEQYEDITLHNESSDLIHDNDCEVPEVEDIGAEDATDDVVDEEEDNEELQRIAKQLSKDYYNYFQFDITSEKKDTDDAIEDLLTHLEEFCGLIEMIRNDSNICVEEVTRNMSAKCEAMEQIYSQIDKLDQFVKTVAKNVGQMDEELTKAEQLFGDDNNNRVKKFFTSFLSNNSKASQSSVKQMNAKYEPKDIFRTSDYIKRLDISPQNCDSNSGHSSQTTNGSIHSAIV